MSILKHIMCWFLILFTPLGLKDLLSVTNMKSCHEGMKLRCAQIDAGIHLQRGGGGGGWFAIKNKVLFLLNCVVSAQKGSYLNKCSALANDECCSLYNA